MTETENPTDDRYFTADDPEDPDTPPGALEDEPPPPDASAPYGYTRDSKHGPWRPKKSPGRPKAGQPTPEEVAARPPIEPGPDEPPGEPDHRPAPSPDDIPMPRGGVIAKGVNRLYRRAGKIARVFDNDVGLAVIECTRKDPEDPEELTVGEAWEELAKVNPRVRGWLLNAIKGGTWQALVFAHAPIGVALLTKDWVRRLIPGLSFERLAEVLLEEDEDSEPGDLRPADADEMRRMAEAQAQKMAAKMGVRVPAGVAAAAMREAEARAAAQEAPEAFRRAQPNRSSRAKRRGR